MNELPRQPRPPTRQTSAQARYITANTNGAQGLRALGKRHLWDEQLAFWRTCSAAG